jgi:hypothetical protein
LIFTETWSDAGQQKNVPNMPLSLLGRLACHASPECNAGTAEQAEVTARTKGPPRLVGHLLNFETFEYVAVTERDEHPLKKAKILKLADKTSNIRAIAASPPADLSVKSRIEYVNWDEAGGRGGT